MKNIIIAVLTVAAFASGAVIFLQSRNSAEQTPPTASLQDEAEQQSQRVTELQDAEECSQKQRAEALEQASRLADNIQAAPKPAEAAPSVGESADKEPARD